MPDLRCNKGAKIILIILLFCFLPVSLHASGDSIDIPSPSFLDKLNMPRKISFRNDTAVIKIRWFIPDHLRLQFAGFSGFFSLGAGYNIRKVYDITFCYGIVNRFMGRSSANVHTFSIRNSFNIALLWDHLVPKAGMTINLSYTNNTFRSLPVHYPDNYYFQNKIHLSPFFGAEWKTSFSNQYINAGGFYAELVTLDSYVLEFLRTRYVKITDIWSFCLGVKIYLF